MCQTQSLTHMCTTHMWVWHICAYICEGHVCICIYRVCVYMSRVYWVWHIRVCQIMTNIDDIYIEMYQCGVRCIFLLSCIAYAYICHRFVVSDTYVLVHICTYICVLYVFICHISHMRVYVTGLLCLYTYVLLHICVQHTCEGHVCICHTSRMRIYVTCVLSLTHTCMSNNDKYRRYINGDVSVWGTMRLSFVMYRICGGFGQ